MIMTNDVLMIMIMKCYQTLAKAKVLLNPRCWRRGASTCEPAGMAASRKMTYCSFAYGFSQGFISSMLLRNRPRLHVKCARKTSSSDSAWLDCSFAFFDVDSFLPVLSKHLCCVLGVIEIGLGLNGSVLVLCDRNRSALKEKQSAGKANRFDEWWLNLTTPGNTHATLAEPVIINGQIQEGDVCKIFLLQVSRIIAGDCCLRRINEYVRVLLKY